MAKIIYDGIKQMVVCGMVTIPTHTAILILLLQLDFSTIQIAAVLVAETDWSRFNTYPP